MGFCGKIDEAVMTLLLFRNAAGFTATDGFLAAPFSVALSSTEAGLTGDLKLSNRVTISVVDPLRLCDGLSGVLRSGGDAFAGEAERRARVDALGDETYID